MEKDKLVVQISFRLSEKEYKPYREMIESTGISKSLLFREIFIAKADTAVAPKVQTKDNKRLLFLASKASNNINQIAKKLNSAYRGEVISERVYLEALNNLITIERSFTSAFDKC